MIGQSVRSAGFWALDRIKGSPVRKRYNYLDELYRTGASNDKALKVLLEHAIRTVPCYKNIVAPDIHCFPVVSKEKYIEQFDSFRSSEYLADEELHKVYTSGSTGNPFMAYQDREKLFWHRAGLISINNRIGWKLGDRFLFFRVWGGAHNAGKLSQIMSNTIPVDVINLNEEKMESMRQQIIKDKSLCLILGYASALEKLSEYLAVKGDGPDEYGIRLIISDSENLSSHAKALIEKTFGCPVLNRYGNNENGIIGLTANGSSSFEINYPEYYVEILKIDKDEPAPQGSMGRIVITDLYNKAFPFIRYDTGDLGIASEMKGEQCFKLQELSGRISSALKDICGNVVGETAVTAFFEDVSGIGRYQVAQTGGKTYEIRVENTTPDLDGQLETRGKRAFGDEAIVKVVHVEKIAQGINGKYKITSFEVN